ncbi:IS5/IS1182 family transposase, partial [[Kitasatospora] papulosa]
HRPRPRHTDTNTTPSVVINHIATIDNLAKRITDETTPTWRGTY